MKFDVRSFVSFGKSKQKIMIQQSMSQNLLTRNKSQNSLKDQACSTISFDETNEGQVDTIENDEDPLDESQLM